MAHILLLEPYMTGSHSAWAKGYSCHSRHQVSLMTLPGRFWKWRMHGGALRLSELFLQSSLKPDLILATDMLDLTTFLALTRKRTSGLPTALYFHENQITYPWSPRDRDVEKSRDHHYGFINVVSALVSDCIFFNSHFHRDSFLGELPAFLNHFPDEPSSETLPRLRANSEVLPLGLSLEQFDAHRPEANKSGRPPLILWNHRWEHDKNPEEFFRALCHLADRGLDFEVAVLGENFSQSPDIFLEARHTLGKRIVTFGYAESFAEYAAWLWRADLLPVTSNQEFFGASVMEALYCGVYPLLPKRLTYPELLPEIFHENHLYSDFDDLIFRLEKAIRSIDSVRKTKVSAIAKPYDWSLMGPVYDTALERLLK